MERLTAKNKHGKPIIKDWPNYMEFDIINRLAAIEDILGDEYELTDVAPVRHGQWLPQIVLGEKAWDCSECKTLGSPHWKWCPMCGCRMDVEATQTCHDGVCEIPGVEEVDDRE